MSCRWSNRYSPWPVPTSPIPTVIRAGRPTRSPYCSKKTVGAYERLFGAEPKVRAIHAGLECGLFLEKYPELEMVSFGPTLRGAFARREARKSPRFPSSGICCSKCSRPSDPPANAANPATDARFPDARFTITAPSLRGRCRCGWCRGYSPAGLTTPVNLTTDMPEVRSKPVHGICPCPCTALLLPSCPGNSPARSFSCRTVCLRFSAFSSVISAESSVMVRLPSGVFGEEVGGETDNAPFAFHGNVVAGG